MVLIGQLTDGVATPLVGILSDATAKNPNSIASRKIWLLIGAILVAATFPEIFNRTVVVHPDTRVGELVYYAFFIVWFQIGWATVQCNHLSMIPVLGVHQRRKVALSSARNVYTIAANVVVFVLAFFLFNGGTGGTGGFTHDDLHLFRDLVYAVVGLGACAVLLFLGLVSNKYVRDEDDEQAPLLGDDAMRQQNACTEGTGDETATALLMHTRSLSRSGPARPDCKLDCALYQKLVLFYGSDAAVTLGGVCEGTGTRCESLSQEADEDRESVPLEKRGGGFAVVQENLSRLVEYERKNETMKAAQWFRSRIFYLVLAMYMISRVLVNQFQVILPLYLARYVVAPTTYLAVGPLVLSIASMVGTSFYNKFVSRSGLLNTFLVSLLGAIISSIGVYFVPVQAPGVVFVFVVFYGIASGWLIPFSVAIVSELVAEKTECSAFCYGFASTADKVVNGAIVYILFAYAPEACEDESEEYYRVTAAGVPILVSIGGLLMFYLLRVQVSALAKQFCASMDMARQAGLSVA